jgi:hypothetical protein
MGTDIVHSSPRAPQRRIGNMPPRRARASVSTSSALTSLEQSLDAAVERRSGAVRRFSEPTDQRSEQTDALAVVPRHRAAARARQLSWNGVAVSNELTLYAARVAQGEELAPYRGPVLAEFEAAFPWNLQAPPALPMPRDVQPRMLEPRMLEPRVLEPHVEPSWSVWQVITLGLLFVGVAIGGAASLMTDDAGSSPGSSWSTASAASSASITPPLAAVRGAPEDARAQARSASSNVSPVATDSTRSASASVTSKPSASARTRTRAPATQRSRQRPSSPSSQAAVVSHVAAATPDDAAPALFLEAPTF